MKFGLTMPPFGPYADPNYLAAIAQEAEAAGWDGFFIWDHVVYDHPSQPTGRSLDRAGCDCGKKNFIHTHGAMITSLARRHP